jgi:hypothetical protein
LRIASARRLALRYAVETFALGTYNLAVDVWITNGAKASASPNPGAIVAEFMILLDYSPGARPQGAAIEGVGIDGERYELFRADGFGAELRGGVGWPLFTFQSRGRSLQGTIDLVPFLRHLVRGGHVRDDQDVASVELGNEVMGGAGTTFVEAFELDVRTGEGSA